MSYQRIAVRKRAMGDVAAVATPVAASDMSQGQWQASMLTVAQQQYAYLQALDRKYTMQRYMQMAATLSIPLAGAVWKWLLGRRNARMSL